MVPFLIGCFVGAIGCLAILMVIIVCVEVRKEEKENVRRDPRMRANG